jgi:hypothetical protein
MKLNRVLHMLAEEMQLNHESKGAGAFRCMIISKRPGVSYALNGANLIATSIPGAVAAPPSKKAPSSTPRPSSSSSSSSSSSNNKANKRMATATWDCAVCTIINPGSARRCHVCGGWPCTKCSFVNMERVKRCQVCDASTAPPMGDIVTNVKPVIVLPPPRAVVADTNNDDAADDDGTMTRGGRNGRPFRVYQQPPEAVVERIARVKAAKAVRDRRPLSRRERRTVERAKQQAAIAHSAAGKAIRRAGGTPPLITSNTAADEEPSPDEDTGNGNGDEKKRTSDPKDDDDSDDNSDDNDEQKGDEKEVDDTEAKKHHKSVAKIVAETKIPSHITVSEAKRVVQRDQFAMLIVTPDGTTKAKVGPAPPDFRAVGRRRRKKDKNRHRQGSDDDDDEDEKEEETDEQRRGRLDAEERASLQLAEEMHYRELVQIFSRNRAIMRRQQRSAPNVQSMGRVVQPETGFFKALPADLIIDHVIKILSMIELTLIQFRACLTHCIDDRFP